mmetsp:Transcript_98053/g.218660  ORF Transcript_98053/g.218660 Transcript_98053/m.218660 type:complete len:288 (+) Transcript_98053:252-1115(+)
MRCCREDNSLSWRSYIPPPWLKCNSLLVSPRRSEPSACIRRREPVTRRAYSSGWRMGRTSSLSTNGSQRSGGPGGGAPSPSPSLLAPLLVPLPPIGESTAMASPPCNNCHSPSPTTSLLWSEVGGREEAGKSAGGKRTPPAFASPAMTAGSSTWKRVDPTLNKSWARSKYRLDGCPSAAKRSHVRFVEYLSSRTKPCSGTCLTSQWYAEICGSRMQRPLLASRPTKRPWDGTTALTPLSGPSVVTSVHLSPSKWTVSSVVPSCRIMRWSTGSSSLTMRKVPVVLPTS